jgi:hypothetical protein
MPLEISGNLLILVILYGVEGYLALWWQNEDADYDSYIMDIIYD